MPETATPQDDPRGDASGGGRGRRIRRILVVEPDFHRRIYAAQVIATLGFRVVLAAGSEEAVAVISKQSGRLDAAIVNLAGASKAAIERIIAAERLDLPLLDMRGEPYSPDRLGEWLGPPRADR